MNKEDCIFCKIVKGEIPSVKIWEDKEFMAFLDASPAAKGHTLIIPKDHYENIFDIPENVLGNCVKIAQKISFILKDKLKADGINLLNSNNKVAQQDVPHFHMHVIPRYKEDDLIIKLENKTEDKDLDKVKEEILRE